MGLRVSPPLWVTKNEDCVGASWLLPSLRGRGTGCFSVSGDGTAALRGSGVKMGEEPREGTSA